MLTPYESNQAKALVRLTLFGGRWWTVDGTWYWQQDNGEALPACQGDTPEELRDRVEQWFRERLQAGGQ